MRLAAMMATLSAVFTIGCHQSEAAGDVPKVERGVQKESKMATVYSGLALETLGGQPLSESELKNRVLLVVNVASQCGYTRQYAPLQRIYEKYEAQGLTVIGIPCNQFGRQEPGSAAEIMEFTRAEYGVTFPLLAKQNVNGANRSPLVERLMDSAASSADVRWNFEKFLVGRSGQVIGRFGSSADPEGPEMTRAIEQALGG